MTFPEFFRQATNDPDPFPYQERLALAEPFPVALCAPTGAGKTAAAVLSWLYRRRIAAPAVRGRTPRRLVLCFPMRTLVNQTESAVAGWLQRLGLDIPICVLLGGELEQRWYLCPHEDAILIGTQDMLLSRALGRGYGASRALWPWLYGLLSNDCLWVFDEVQLMGPGLATGLQLQGLRQKLGAFGPNHALFMSATLERDWLGTVDHPVPATAQVHTLDSADLRHPQLLARRTAAKILRRADYVVPKSDKDLRSSIGKLAQEVMADHRPGTLTLVVLNTVSRAAVLYDAMQKLRRDEPLDLLHSRFRPPDRRQVIDQILARRTGIVVATQVVEAGVDLSARSLFMELSPWAALVQRAGRCNRRGEFPAADPGHIAWIDHQSLEDTAAPYEPADLQRARLALGPLTQFNPATIETAGIPLERYQPPHVLRRRDLESLFDTTPDLGGVDLDVGRYIREGTDRDVQVAWRDLEEGAAPPADTRRLQRDELCQMPLGDLKDWVKKRRAVYAWDFISGRWSPVEDRDKLVPGASYLLRSAEGGYDPRRGYSFDHAGPVAPVPLDPPRAGQPDAEDALSSDPQSEIGCWVSLRQHAEDTARHAAALVEPLGFLDPALKQALKTAARAHDLGKAHDVFQRTMRSGCPLPDADRELWAKSGSRQRHERPGFRHELASALSWLQAGPPDERELIAYLLAAHHGKVRVSLRALPGDAPPDSTGAGARLHARGIWDGDLLPAADLGGGLTVPACQLSLEPMRLGGAPGGAPSWSEIVHALLVRLGPFRLAYLEGLIRAADWLASRQESPSAEEARR